MIEAQIPILKHGIPRQNEEYGKLLSADPNHWVSICYVLRAGRLRPACSVLRTCHPSLEKEVTNYYTVISCQFSNH